MARKIGYILLGVLFVGCSLVFIGYKAIWQDNVNDEKLASQYLDIPKKSSFDDVVAILEAKGLLHDLTSFKQVARLMKYDKASVPSGRYEIDKSWNNRQLISVLRSGRQVPVSVTFNNQRNIEETLGAISQYLGIDSASLVQYTTDTATLQLYGHTSETILSMFIPNTYQMYWDCTAAELLERMHKEHKKFWANDSRLEKAEILGLSPQEVYTLASIVEKESQAAKERPIIAGLYLNRLERGIPLQADPTVVFAVGDFGIRRVLHKHLAHDSPYNTYMYSGLPPGPIYLPSIQSIDAVLNPTNHDYLFMCAKPGYGSEHAFAKTAAEHNRNANAYRTWLTSEGIR